MIEDKQKERLEKAEQKAKLCTFLFMGFIAFCLLLAAYSHTEDMEKAQKITGTVSNKYMVLSNSLLQKMVHPLVMDLQLHLLIYILLFLNLHLFDLQV